MHEFTVKISVTDNWFQDGFDLTKQEEDLKNAILERMLGYAYPPR